MNFDQTQEAQEWINKLTAERIQLPSEATPLEAEALGNLKNGQTELRQITTKRADLEKQIGLLKSQHEQMGRDTDVKSGELTAYARLLVSAEGARRTLAEAESKAKPEPEDTDVAEAPENGTPAAKSDKPPKTKAKAPTSKAAVAN